MLHLLNAVHVILASMYELGHTDAKLQGLQLWSSGMSYSSFWENKRRLHSYQDGWQWKIGPPKVSSSPIRSHTFTPLYLGYSDIHMGRYTGWDGSWGFTGTWFKIAGIECDFYLFSFLNSLWILNKKTGNLSELSLGVIVNSSLVKCTIDCRRWLVGYAMLILRVPLW